MFKLIIYGFLFYLLYKFIFELLIPVSKATVQVKDKLREMQEQQNTRQQYHQQTTASSVPGNDKRKEDDYIDFEEVKK